MKYLDNLKERILEIRNKKLNDEKLIKNINTRNHIKKEIFLYD
jgi:hypothetical protein